MANSHVASLALRTLVVLWVCNFVAGVRMKTKSAAVSGPAQTSQSSRPATMDEPIREAEFAAEAAVAAPEFTQEDVIVLGQSAGQWLSNMLGKAIVDRLMISVGESAKIGIPLACVLFRNHVEKDLTAAMGGADTVELASAADNTSEVGPIEGQVSDVLSRRAQNYGQAWRYFQDLVAGHFQDVVQVVTTGAQTSLPPEIRASAVAWFERMWSDESEYDDIKRVWSGLDSERLGKACVLFKSRMEMMHQQHHMR